MSILGSGDSLRKRTTHPYIGLPPACTSERSRDAVDNLNKGRETSGAHRWRSHTGSRSSMTASPWRAWSPRRRWSWSTGRSSRGTRKGMRPSEARTATTSS